MNGRYQMREENAGLKKFFPSNRDFNILVHLNVSYRTSPCLGFFLFFYTSKSFSATVICIICEKRK
jgi:hypothetical protein